MRAKDLKAHNLPRGHEILNSKDMTKATIHYTELTQCTVKVYYCISQLNKLNRMT